MNLNMLETGLMCNFRNWLTKMFEQKVLFDEPMARHTSLKVGGPAEYFVAPENIEDVRTLVGKAEENHIPWLVMGCGTNLLVKDSGIRGMVITMINMKQKVQSPLQSDDVAEVSVLAGTRLGTLCRFAMDNGLSGMNFALGIPGTVGGAIRMNAGTAKGEIADVIDRINILEPSGSINEYSKNDMVFSYRNLNIKNIAQPVILEGAFTLKKGDPDAIKKEAETFLAHRKTNQPSGASAGSFFKNPPSSHPAGKLIDMAGLKGTQMGGAKISEKHANFIMNTGSASADDVLKLMAIVQEKVFQEFNVRLEPEVKIVD